MAFDSTAQLAKLRGKWARFSVSVGGAALAAALLSGCASPSTPAPAVAASASNPAIGEPCQLSSPASATDGGGRSPRVFVELAAVEGDLDAVMRAPALRPGGPASPRPPGFAQLLNDPRVRIPRILHVLASDGGARTVAWDVEKKNSADQCPQVERWDLTVTAHVDATQPSNVRLEVARAPAPPLGTRPEDWYIPEHRRAQTTVVVRDQQTVVLGGLGEPDLQQARSTLLITPYVIWEEADLRRLFECKMKRAGATAPARLP